MICQITLNWPSGIPEPALIHTLVKLNSAPGREYPTTETLRIQQGEVTRFWNQEGGHLWEARVWCYLPNAFLFLSKRGLSLGPQARK